VSLFLQIKLREWAFPVLRKVSRRPEWCFLWQEVLAWSETPLVIHTWWPRSSSRACLTSRKLTAASQEGKYITSSQEALRQPRSWAKGPPNFLVSRPPPLNPLPPTHPSRIKVIQASNFSSKIQMVPNSGWFYSGLFKFTMMLKQYTSNRNCTLNLDLFLGLTIYGLILPVCQASAKSRLQWVLQSRGATDSMEGYAAELGLLGLVA
jgi:hypothetical protein